MEPKLKILHLSSAVRWRGGENQIWLLCRELKALGVEQKLMMPSGQAFERMVKKGIAPGALKFRQAWFLYDALRIAGLCSKEGWHIIHAHDSKAHTTAAIAIKIFNAPAKMIVHRRVDNPLRTNFVSRWKYSRDSLGAIICVSDHIKNTMSRYIEQPDKLHTIHSSADFPKSSEADPGAVNLRKLLKIPAEAKIVGNVSALDQHKDPITFLKTALITLGSRKNVHFVWIGADAGMEQQCRVFVKENKLGNRIHFTGYLEDAARLISQMDLFLFTSKTEGLGSTLLDSMARNTPIVSTSAGGPAELIDHQKTGWLADVGNPKQLAEGIDFFLSETDRAESVAMEARKFAEKNFSPAAMGEKTLKIYRQIMGSYQKVR